MIDEEKRRDEFLRKVSRIAWTATFVVVLLFAGVLIIRVIHMIQLFGVGRLYDRLTIVNAAIPLLVVLGFLCVLVATLSTIGVFMRFRTASLAEIQLRLAALEEILINRKDSDS
ncbi:MAG: hypothetical protein ACT443_11635 [Gemmatimonadota bacterium]